MSNKEDFIKYLDEVQKEFQDDVNKYYKLVNDREKAGMNTYGIESPKMKLALIDSTAIINLKSLINKFDSLEEVEKIIRKAKAENEDDVMVNRALNYIEGYQSLDNKNGLSM